MVKKILSCHWVEIVLVSCLLLIFSAAVGKTELVAGLTFFVYLTFSTLIGVAVGISGFSVRISAFYLITMAILGVFLVESEILPSMLRGLGDGLTENLWLTNLRALVYLDQLKSWLMIALGGEWPSSFAAQSTAVILVSCLTCGILGWRLARRRDVLGPVLLLLVLAALMAYFNHISITYLIVGACVGMLLAIFAVHRRLHHYWDANHVDYPDMDYEWLYSSGLVTIIITGLVVAVPVVGTPEGWRQIAEQVEEMTEDLWQEPTPTPSFEGGTIQIKPSPTPLGLEGVRPETTNDPSDDPLTFLNYDLDKIRLPADPTSDETVFWVTVSQLPSNGSYYWRSMVYDQYNGQGWRRVQLQDRESPARLFSDSAAVEIIEQQFEIASPDLELPVSLNEPILAGEHMEIVYTIPDHSALLAGSANKYRVISRRIIYRIADLRNANQEYPAVVKDSYLQLPETLPGRVADLAARISGSGDTPYDRVILLRDYLRHTYPYSLDVPFPPPDRDIVDYFLFDAPGGFCSYYASAMVVMLRTQGIPSRLASGFSSGVFHKQFAAYRVPGSAFHVWVEVYFPGFGWIEFEPTAGRPLVEQRVDEAADQERDPPMIAWLIASIAGIVYRYFPILIVIIAGLLVFMGLNQLQRRPKTQQEWTERLLSELRTFLEKSEDVPISATPYEMKSIFQAQYPEQYKLLDVIENVIAIHVQTVYSASIPGKDDLLRVRHAWRYSLILRMRLIIKEWLRKWLRGLKRLKSRATNSFHPQT